MATLAVPPPHGLPWPWSGPTIAAYVNPGMDVVCKKRDHYPAVVELLAPASLAEAMARRLIVACRRTRSGLYNDIVSSGLLPNARGSIILYIHSGAEIIPPFF